jgi:dolichol-phosphate mannosyltransferase
MDQQLDGRVRGDLARKPRVVAVIPCYRERAHILDVLARVPPEVAHIICVDDGCPYQTGAIIQ